MNIFKKTLIFSAIGLMIAAQMPVQAMDGKSRVSERLAKQLPKEERARQAQANRLSGEMQLNLLVKTNTTLEDFKTAFERLKTQGYDLKNQGAALLKRAAQQDNREIALWLIDQGVAITAEILAGPMAPDMKQFLASRQASIAALRKVEAEAKARTDALVLVKQPTGSLNVVTANGTASIKNKGSWTRTFVTLGVAGAVAVAAIYAYRAWRNS